MIEGCAWYRKNKLVRTCGYFELYRKLNIPAIRQNRSYCYSPASLHLCTCSAVAFQDLNMLQQVLHAMHAHIRFGSLPVFFEVFLSWVKDLLIGERSHTNNTSTSTYNESIVN